jgi:Ca2+-binding EF-hand superfamily protein
MLDVQAKGWITVPELSDTLSELGHYAHRELIYLFVRRFDRDNDGRLLYSDFTDAFTPHSLNHALTLSSRKAHYLHTPLDKLDYFTAETRALYLKTFKLYFQVEESIELLRKRLAKRPQFSVHEAFAAVDQDRNGFITRPEIKAILNEYGFYCTDTELTMLIDRYDRNHDGKVSYAEFVEEIKPRSNGI